MTLEDFFQQLHDFGISMNLSVEQLYSDDSSQFKINQNQNHKPNYVKYGIEFDNQDCYIIFLAVFIKDENKIRYMNSEQQLRLCRVDEVGLELCKHSILEGIKIRKEEKNQCRLDDINKDF